MASAVSPLAARTKHPVCLAAPDSADPALLSRLFEGFELRAWRSADDPLLETEEHLLFWRLSQSVPPRMLLLDTPDVDSDMPINWERAWRIRQVADVLIAVLTQQKYNDAAVKQFFREAAQADNPSWCFSINAIWRPTGRIGRFGCKPSANRPGRIRCGCMW